MADLAIRAIFAGMVQRLGGVDAAAAVLEARYGTGCKGTISRMCAGHAGVTVEAAVAIEDALGSYPLTRRLAERMGGTLPAPASLQVLAAQSAVESGAAQAALITALSPDSPGGADLTPAERAAALAKAVTARDAQQAIIDQIEAMGGRGYVPGPRGRVA